MRHEGHDRSVPDHPGDRRGEPAAVAAVYAELAATDPGGLHYATFRLDDGVTFVHVATVDGENPLPRTAAFQAFQAGLKDRCVTGPAPSGATLVGSYGVGPA